MEIIQTLNCGTNFSLLDEQMQYLLDSSVVGIRLNFNKFCGIQDIINWTELADIVMKYKGRYKFLYDIPYPYNKTRIQDYKLKEKRIRNNEIYELYFDILEYSKRQENTILLSSLDEMYSEEDVIYFGDGQGAFEIVKREKDKIIVKAITEFEIYKNKSITYGKSSIQCNLNEILSLINNVYSSGDYGCALSLVESSKEVRDFKRLINHNIELLAKIETPKSIENLDSIMLEADGVMVARGDLALLNKYYELYFIIEHIIKKGESYGKNLYMATDILQSMDSGRYIPSRSDIMDLSNIYLSKCDFIILGYNPSESIMKRKISVAGKIHDEIKKNT